MTIEVEGVKLYLQFKILVTSKRRLNMNAPLVNAVETRKNNKKIKGKKKGLQ